MRRLPGLGVNGASANGVARGAVRALRGLVLTPGPNPSNRMNAANLRHISQASIHYAAMQQLQPPEVGATALQDRISPKLYQEKAFAAAFARSRRYLPHGICGSCTGSAQSV